MFLDQLSSEMHSSTIFFRFGFSIAAAILSLSLICLLTEKEKNRKVSVKFVEEVFNNHIFIETLANRCCNPEANKRR